MRLLFVDQIPTPYRAPFYRLLSAEAFHEIRVLYCAQPPQSRGWRQDVLDFPHEFLPGIRFPGPDHGELYANLRVVREVRANADVVIVSGWIQPTCLLAAAAAKFSGIPYVIASESHAKHGRSRLAKAARATVFSRVARAASAGLAAGTQARDYMVSLGLLEDAVFIFPNACDVQRIMAESDAARRDGRAAAMRLRYAGTKPLVLFVGRLIPTKDVGTLLTALERLARAGTPVACALAGAGQERSALERQVRQLRLPNVSFLGEVENSALPSLYAAADVVCLPSIEEPWGVVVNEALAAGCPVVCSEAVGAAADMIRPGENGAIFSTRDAEALARSLQDVIQLDRHIALEHARAVARLWDYSRMRAGLYQSISLATGP